ncbi:hypothetical protein MKL09_28195 [Methylobacterium sp. J-048]|uniref:hypothetical protein n=1 Tax=Methylobacterium sp. J-048 TaxID=2836635 RepID=UPI001FBA4D71|nr:hypothetical protein [Methylobacterium sp. J-048]MCJ2060394.1 hypothetical protein [Methylobacterium sp. J-048]
MRVFAGVREHPTLGRGLPAVRAGTLESLGTSTMNDLGSHERDAHRSSRHDIDVRLGQHAVGLLQGARDSGDPALIEQAEAMAMAVGFALASRLLGSGETGES